ncbi:ComF family protein [Paenibacillus sp. SN-8-1]|uniref:ComF family protein n=1 Tax=Paenibacillus sp. SN-8-1 TaxID=3435409 RepID=UPI003D9A1E74
MKWTQLLDPLRGLLTPSGTNCMTCGKPMQSGAREHPEICRECTAAIPWIRHPRCPKCGRHIGCPDCTRPGAKARPFLLNRSAVAYDPRMREWLAAYKYRGQETLAPMLARMMGQAYKTLASELSAVHGRSMPWRIDAVTCVPLSSQRLAERGFNQAELLASGAAAAARAPLIAMLERSRDTEKMSLKGRGQRLHSMQGVFRTLPQTEELLLSILHKRRTRISSSQNSPLRLLLVDDIYTTGSTVGFCSEALLGTCREAGITVEIYCLTWARS